MLRAKSLTTPSQKWTSAFVASFLDMKSADSATANVVRPMRVLGLIAEDGSLTALGNKWRVDATYAEACEEILKKVYPDELSGFTNADGTPDQIAVTTWMKHQGMGESNAKQMAATYVMIASKMVPEAATPNGKDPKPTPRKTPTLVSTPPAETKSTPAARGDASGVAPPQRPSGGPQIHLDIQIHIPPDATAQQIDTIFESMAKHLYK